jgi:hypothetical protein
MVSYSGPSLTPMDFLLGFLLRLFSPSSPRGLFPTRGLAPAVVLLVLVPGLTGCQNSSDASSSPADSSGTTSVAEITLGREAVPDTVKGLPGNLYRRPGEEEIVTKGRAKPAIPPVDISAIQAGVPVRGVIGDSDPALKDGSRFDGWVYRGQAGETVDLQMRSTVLDAYLILARYDDGTVRRIAENDDGGEGTDARLRGKLPATSIYLVLANTAGPDDRGLYELSLRSSLENSSHSAERDASLSPIAYGETVQGALETGDTQLDSGAYVDVYQFRGEAGQTVVVDVASVDFDPLVGLVVRTENGKLAPVARDDDSGEGRNANLQLDLPLSAVYGVWVGAHGNRPVTGTYTLRLRRDDQRAGDGTPAPEAPEGALFVDRLPTRDGVDYAARYPGNGDPSARYALLVGIDDYPGDDSDLPSSVADASLMKQALVDVYGFEESNIVVLTDGEATREHVLHAFARHLGQAGTEGAAVFYFSGHGLQVGDNIGLTGDDDPEDDGSDESIALWSAPPDQGGRGTVILDDEIGILIRQLRTERTLIILDACHSGTGTRGTNVDYPVKELRWVDVSSQFILPAPGFTVNAVVAKGAVSEATGEPPGAPASSAGASEVATGPGDHVLLAASAADEVALASGRAWPTRAWPAKDGSSEPLRGSVFTYFLTQTMADLGPDTTLETLMEQVRTYTVNYSRNRAGRVQTPQLEGRRQSASLRGLLGATP